MADATAELGLALGIERVVETNAGREGLHAVERAVVAEAGGGLEGRVQGRPDAGVSQVQTDTESDVQAVAGGPFRLAEDGVGRELGDVGERPDGGIHIVARDDAVGVVQEVVEVPERHEAIRAGAEEVEEVGPLAFDAAGEHIVLPEIVTLGGELPVDDVDDVAMAELLGAGNVGAGARRDVGAEVGAGKAIDHHQRRRRVRGGQLVVRGVGVLDLGLEVRGPLAEELDGVGLADAGLVIEVAGGRGADLAAGHAVDGDAAAEVAELGHRSVGLGITDAEFVTGHDVPVDLGQDFLVRLGVGGGLGDGVAPRDGRGIRFQASENLGLNAAGRREGQLASVADAFVVFVVQEEEQLVADDRAAEGAAPGGALEFRHDLLACEGQFAGIGPLQLHARQFVAAEVEVGGAVERIGAALGHGIDRRAGETRKADVVGGDLDGQLLDGVDGEGIEERRDARAVEAEHVIGARTVDHDRIEAVVLADGGDVGLLAVVGTREGVHGHQGIGADQVGERALGGRLAGHAIAVEDGAGAAGRGVEVALAASGHEFLELQHVGFELQGHGDIVAQLGDDVVGGLAGEAGGGGADAEGSADRETAEVKTSAFGRHGRVGGVGRQVDCGHRGAGHRFSVRRHDGARYAGSHDLCLQAGRKQHGQGGDCG